MGATKDIVVVGASAGGVSALKELVKGLPEKLDAAVFCVLHLSPSSPSHLEQILRRHSRMPIAEARDGEPIRHGQIYLARPDYHLVLNEKTVQLTRGPRENRSRPAIDALFRSAAYMHAGRVIGVVLTGSLDDGTAGLWSVKDRGGTTIVQDPADAEVPSMPKNAIDYVRVDHVVRLRELAPLLAELTQQPANPLPEERVSKEMEIETQIAKEGRGLQLGVMQLGRVTPYTCPDCHGVLVELKGGGVPRVRCHTGHAYSLNNLLAQVTESVEESLWNSIRTIEESVMLLQHIGRHIREKDKDHDRADLFDAKAADTQRHADLIRQAAMEHQTLSKENIAEVKSSTR
jgi:two-component system chemotaxis response regulator CheB